MANPLNNFENVLNQIQSRYISLPDHEVRRNNEILSRVLDDIIKEMKNVDELFRTHYKRIFYGGSFFDGLRVEKPEEFDLDLLLTVPKIGLPELSTHTNQPGFLHLKFAAPDKLSDAFKRKMLDDKYFLSTSKVMQWMESVFTKAMNKFSTPGGGYEFIGDNYHLKGRKSKSGPAMTLILRGQGINIDVDFVPCVEFGRDKWPTGGYKKNPVANKRDTFFIVPKSPKDVPFHSDRYWRLSFQEQERELLNGKRTLKPTLKILKRLRDFLQHKAIASYYIKTVFLWEDEKNGASYWNGTLTDAFFKMLRAYIQYLDDGKIPYFWNKKNNLLKVSPETLSNMKNRLKAIEKDILNNYKTDPKIICTYLDTPLVNRQSSIDLQGASYYPQSLFNDNPSSSSVATFSPVKRDIKETEESSSGLSGWATAGIVAAGVGILAARIGAAVLFENGDNGDEEKKKKYDAK